MASFCIVFDHSRLARASEPIRDSQNDGQILLHKIFRADVYDKSSNKMHLLNCVPFKTTPSLAKVV